MRKRRTVTLRSLSERYFCREWRCSLRTPLSSLADALGSVNVRGPFLRFIFYLWFWLNRRSTIDLEVIAFAELPLSIRRPGGRGPIGLALACTLHRRCPGWVGDFRSRYLVFYW